jgi:hypothetical protein
MIVKQKVYYKPFIQTLSIDIQNLLAGSGETIEIPIENGNPSDGVGGAKEHFETNEEDYNENLLN